MHQLNESESQDIIKLTKQIKHTKEESWNSLHESLVGTQLAGEVKEKPPNLLMSSMQSI